VSSSINILQNVVSVDDSSNAAATETVPLFEHLEFEFLLQYDVFDRLKRRRTRVHEPSDLCCGFLHCYYEDVYGTRLVTRELQNSLVWYYCGLDRPPSRGTIDRFLTDLEYVINDVFDRVIEQTAIRALLNSTYSIDSTHVEAIQYNDAASWNYDSTAEKIPLRLRLYTRLNRRANPDSEFTQIKRRRFVSRVARSASIHQSGFWRQRPRHP
jgi:hypothetical protein